MTLTQLFTNIANAIRNKKGTTELIQAANFATEIENLPSGGIKVPITNTYYLFYKRSDLIENANDYFDFSNCILFEYCFYAVETNKIPLIDTSKGINFNNMLSNCSNLTTIPQLDTGEGLYFSGMLSNCSNLTTIPQLNTSKGTIFNNMFYRCSNLTTIPQLDAGKVENVNNVVSQCTKLTTMGGLKDIGKAYAQKANNYTNYKLDLSTCNNLTHDSLTNIINNLYDLNLTYDVANSGTLYTQQLVLGATNKAKLTAEEIAIATNKGWTVS